MKRPISLGLLLAPAVFCAPVDFVTSDLPRAALGSPYSVSIETAVDGRCPNSDAAVTVATGVLPPGLELRGALLTGVPRRIGAFRFALKAANPCGQTVRDFALMVAGKPILRVYPETISLEYRAGQPALDAGVFGVSADWSGLPYSVRAEDSWLSALPRSGMTPDRDSGFSADVVSVAVDLRNLKPGVYRSALRVAAMTAVNAPAVTVVLKVLP